jgi:hypothetical protein
MLIAIPARLTATMLTSSAQRTARQRITSQMPRCFDAASCAITRKAGTKQDSASSLLVANRTSRGTRGGKEESPDVSVGRVTGVVVGRDRRA